MKKILLLTAISFLTIPSFAGEHNFSGSIETELQIFTSKGELEEQKDVFGSIALRPEYSYRSENRAHRLKAQLFVRATEPNGSRTHGDIRELNYLYSNSGWYAKAGIDTIFWGVTESAHLVDVINQTDNLESISGEEKLGQPMLAIGVEKSFGNIDLFVLPYFRTREFTTGPERFQIGLDGQSPEMESDENFYESNEEENNVDLALRWYRSFDNFDLGLSYFNGTSREPMPVILNLLASINTTTGELEAETMGSYYEQQQQIGLEFQYLYDDWIFKLESTHQIVDSGDYSEAVAGFEYTFSDLSPWGQDVGVLLEYLWNDRDFVELGQYSIDADPAIINPNDPNDPTLITIRAVGVEGHYLSPMQNDLFIATRFALNDISGTEFIAGAIFDLDDGSASITFEGSTRIGDDLRVTANVYFFENVHSKNPFKSLENDDLVELKAEWFF